MANSIFPQKREVYPNYNYYDTQERTGYNIYYGLIGDNGEYLLSVSNLVYSEEIVSYIDQSPVSDSATKYFDLDFDLQFNFPKNIKGKLIANIPIGITSTNTTQWDFEYYAIVKAIHYDGSTETTLATGTSRTVSQSGNYGIADGGIKHSSMVAVCEMDISTLKHFKKGEILRLTVEGWFKSLESAPGRRAYIFIGHDPRNRNATTSSEPLANATTILGNEVYGGGTVTYQATQMSFHVPFVLDL